MRESAFQAFGGSSRQPFRGLYLACVLAVTLGANLHAKTLFTSSELTNRCSDVLSADLDGDGLKDLVLVDDVELSIYYQDATQGFGRSPNQTYQLDHRPAVLWATRLGRPAESLLVLTTDGVSELVMANRTAKPELRQIIRQNTIVPESCEGTNLLLLSLSAETTQPLSSALSERNGTHSSGGRSWPLLLVPAFDGLQVWRHQEHWQLAQVLSNSIESRLRPELVNPGYDALSSLNLCIDDINHDGLEDVMVRRREIGQTNTYRLFVQQTNGLFASVLDYGDPIEPHSWLGWVDLNGDGKIDLVKSTWLNEPSFVPAHSSGKVLVRTYLAEAQGTVPTQPQQVFRKNDWLPPVPLVDIDGDGLPDLVLGFSPLDTREGVRKEITAKQLDLNLRIFFGRPTGFPTEPDCQRDLVIRMDEAALLLSWGRGLYFERYIEFGGDFDGDGKADLLIHDRKDTISVYSFLSRQKGFSAEPIQRFGCPGIIDSWIITDLNGDGVSDLIAKVASPSVLRVFVSHK